MVSTANLPPGEPTTTDHNTGPTPVCQAMPEPLSVGIQEALLGDAQGPGDAQQDRARRQPMLAGLDDEDIALGDVSAVGERRRGEPLGLAQLPHALRQLTGCHASLRRVAPPRREWGTLASVPVT